MTWDYALLSARTPVSPLRACNCVGPRPGEPVCPCRMRGVKVRNGRYVEITDLGPAPEGKSTPRVED